MWICYNLIKCKSTDPSGEIGFIVVIEKKFNSLSCYWQPNTLQSKYWNLRKKLPQTSKTSKVFPHNHLCK